MDKTSVQSDNIMELPGFLTKHRTRYNKKIYIKACTKTYLQNLTYYRYHQCAHYIRFKTENKTVFRTSQLM